MNEQPMQTRDRDRPFVVLTRNRQTGAMYASIVWARGSREAAVLKHKDATLGAHQVVAVTTSGPPTEAQPRSGSILKEVEIVDSPSAVLAGDYVDRRFE